MKNYQFSHIIYIHHPIDIKIIISYISSIKVIFLNIKSYFYIKLHICIRIAYFHSFNVKISIFDILHQNVFDNMKIHIFELEPHFMIQWCNHHYCLLHYFKIFHNNSFKSMNHVHPFDHSRCIDRYFMLTCYLSGWIYEIAHSCANLCFGGVF